MSSELLSIQLRTGQSDSLRRRRKIAGLSLVSIGSMSVIALYQLGLLKRLPDLPLSSFNAEKVTSSAEGYKFFKVPDSVLGIGSSAATLALAAMDHDGRTQKRSWIPLALAGKTTLDLLVGGKLAFDQVTKHKALCSWCLVSGATAIGTFSLAFPDGRNALRQLRG